MKTRFLLSITLVLATAPAFAQFFARGSVIIEDEVTNPFTTVQPWYEMWAFEPLGSVNYAAATGGTLLINDYIPYNGAGHLVVPSPDLMVFNHDKTVSWWNTVPTSAFDGDKGYVDIFRDDADLTEIAALRGGRFLVAERSATPARGAKLIEFNVGGIMAEHDFPANIVGDVAVGAAHIEVLADQCTVLYTTGDMDPRGNRVRRMNICTNAAMSDFASLLPSQYAGAIRRLPGGDVLVADGVAVLRFNADGDLAQSYEFPGVTHVALSSDGNSFYAAGVDTDRASFRHYDISEQSIMLGNPEMSSSSIPQRINDLVTVGEWRAATTAASPRFRAVRH